MPSLVLPDYARAPLFIPGRRNRKVRWNRALSKAIESLGTFEREDWRRAKWLPKSLRGFYPKWFASKNKAGCTCCSESDPCVDCEDCLGGGTYSDCEVDVPAFTDNHCTDCELIEGTYILNPVLDQCSWDYQDSDSGICGAFTVLAISVIFACEDGKCRVSGQVLTNRSALVLQSSWYNIGPIAGGPVNYYTFSSLPWSLPYVEDTQVGSGTSNCTAGPDPMIVQGFA